MRAHVTVREHIQLVPLSVFPGSLILQVVFEGGIDGIFVCVCVGREEKVGRETGV